MYDRYGVYVVTGDNGECVYVGRSADPERRIRSHMYSGLISSNHVVSVIMCNKKDVNAIEMELIHELQPLINQRGKAHKLYSIDDAVSSAEFLLV